MNESTLRPTAFPQYKKLSPTRLLAEASTLEICGQTIILAGPDRATLINVLNQIAPDIDWPEQYFAPISIAFLARQQSVIG